MNNLVIRGTQEFLGMNIPVVEGGFGEGQKCMLAKTIAEVHCEDLKRINQIINRNIDEFEFGVDILDLKETVTECNRSESLVDMLLQAGYSLQNIKVSKNIYLLSEQGYMLLVGFMQTDKAKEIRKQLRRDYFSMRAEKRNEYQAPKTPEEIMIYQLQEQQKIKEQQQQMKQQINQVNHRTLKVENEIDNLPLLTVDCNELSSLAKRKIVALLGGKDAPAYKKCNRKAFSDLYKELHRNFGVTSMCAIKRKDLELAKQVITNYKFPIVLKQEVDNINNQISLEMERAL